MRKVLSKTKAFTMENIDSFVLKKHQLAADWFQDWFGKNNFFLAKILIFVEISLRIILDFEYAFRERGSFSVGDFPFFLVLINLWFWFDIWREEKGQGAVNPVFKNGLETRWQLFRQISLMVFCVLFVLYIVRCVDIALAQSTKETELAILLKICWLLSSVSWIYFACCTPKPPKPSRIKEFVSKLKESLNGSTATSPQPA